MYNVIFDESQLFRNIILLYIQGSTVRQIYTIQHCSLYTFRIKYNNFIKIIGFVEYEYLVIYYCTKTNLLF